MNKREQILRLLAEPDSSPRRGYLIRYPERPSRPRGSVTGAIQIQLDLPNVETCSTLGKTPGIVPRPYHLVCGAGEYQKNKEQAEQQKILRTPKTPAFGI